MTTQDRITLALSACVGMTDAELAERGPQAFSKMITRKRKYASVARFLAVGMTEMKKNLDATSEQLKKATSNLAQLEALDKPVTDTSQAAGMLAAFNKKEAE